MNSSNPTSSPASTPPLDTTQALWQLRAIVCGLGAMVILLSLSFNLFVWKQNRNITALTNNRRGQLAQLQANQQRIISVVNDLAKYSADKPELNAIFKKHGVEITIPPSSAGQEALPKP
jgi:hypothetical protein